MCVKTKKGGKSTTLLLPPPPPHTHTLKRQVFLLLKSTDSFCNLKVQSIQIILKCSGERAFSFELTRTSDLHDLAATNFVGSLFCCDSVNTRLLKHPSFCKQHSSASAEICLFRIIFSVHVFNIVFSDIF